MNEQRLHEIKKVAQGAVTSYFALSLDPKYRGPNFRFSDSPFHEAMLAGCSLSLSKNGQFLEPDEENILNNWLKTYWNEILQKSRISDQTPEKEKQMRFVNLTPHVIRIRCGIEHQIEVEPSGTVARISTRQGDLQRPINGPANWIQVYGAPTYGDPEGLPDPEEGTAFLVSALFIGRVGTRTDVYCPGTGPNDNCIRDDKGQIIAVTRLIRCGT